MDPLTLFLMLASGIGGLISGGVGQAQQNRAQRQQVEAERAQREAAAEVAARRREQIQAVLESNRANIDRMAEAILRGAEYSGLEAGASREASRNVAASRAAAALSGVGDSGMAESQAGAIMADAIGQTALARQADQLQRQQLIGQQEAQLQQLAAQLLQDPAFNTGTGEELTAGFDHLTQGQNVFGGSLMGGIGAILPLLGQFALSSMGATDDNTSAVAADAANVATNTTPLPSTPFSTGFAVNPTNPLGSPFSFMPLLGQSQQQRRAGGGGFGGGGSGGRNWELY